MIKREDVLKDIKGSIFEAITASCCMEEDLLGKATYYLHGDEETGDLYECSSEHNPENVIFTASYQGELPDDGMGGFEYESMDNPDFAEMVEDLADQWKEKYAADPQGGGKVDIMTIKNFYGVEIDFEVAENFMNDELREEIHADMAPCTEQEFFDEYAKRHEAKFGEEWELAKENPCY